MNTPQQAEGYLAEFFIKQGGCRRSYDYMLIIREVLYTIGRKMPGRVVATSSLVMAGIALWLMTGLIMAEIVGRNLFSFGVPFAIEYAEYMVPAVGVGGAAYCLSKNGHVRVAFMIQRMADRPRQWIILLGLVTGLAFTILATILFFKLALVAIQRGDTALYPTETLIGYPELILGIGFSLFALQLVIEIFRKARLLLV